MVIVPLPVLPTGLSARLPRCCNGQGKKNRYLAWAEPFAAEVGGRVGFVDGVLTNHTHGLLEARRYRDRHDILVRQDFDPSRDLVRGQDGCWRFAGNKPGLEREIRAYFGTRQD